MSEGTMSNTEPSSEGGAPPKVPSTRAAQQPGLPKSARGVPPNLPPGRKQQPGMQMNVGGVPPNLPSGRMQQPVMPMNVRGRRGVPPNLPPGRFMQQPGLPMSVRTTWDPVPIIPNAAATPGVDSLAVVDHLIVKQQVELMELVLGYETSNSYVLFNKLGQQIYYAFEESGCCERQYCGRQRSFAIHILDNFGKEVMTVFRHLQCCADVCSCCASPGNCCAMELNIEMPPGNWIGTVDQRPSCCVPHYQVTDKDGNAVLLINNPDCCVLCFTCGDHEFKVTGLEGTEVGKIRKFEANSFQELFTDADTFGVAFPADLDVNLKAILLGATFLIDFMFFENK